MARKRQICWFVICFLIATALAGCGAGTANERGGAPEGQSGEQSGKNTDRQVTISFWKAPHVKNEKELWDNIIAKFEEENPNIRVEFLETPWDGWDQKYTAAFAGSNPPDVSYMSEYFVKFAKSGKLHDLSSLMRDETGKYSQSIIDYLTVDGKIYTKPFLAVTSVILYNKDLFEKENVQIPQTWDEFAEAAKKLTKGPDQWGVANFDKLNTIAWMGQAGAVLYADNNRDVTQLGLDTPEGVKGLQFLTDLVLTHKVAPPVDFYTGDQQGQAFYQNGKIAMYPAQVSFTGTIKANNPDFRFGAFVNPAGPASDPAKQREAYAGIGTLAIAEASKHKEEAWKFIQFVTSPENAKMYLEPAGFFSPMPEVNETMYEGDEIMEVAKQTIETMQVWTPNEKFGKVLDIVEQMRQAAFRGVKTPEQAIKDAVKEYASQ